MKRFWRYRYGTWTPSAWYNYLIPERGDDEYGQATLVFHVPFVGFIVWAYNRICTCEDCELLREERQEGAWDGLT